MLYNSDMHGGCEPAAFEASDLQAIGQAVADFFAIGHGTIIISHHDDFSVSVNGRGTVMREELIAALHAVLPPKAMRRCGKCRMMKPLSAFDRKYKNSERRMGTCHACLMEAQRKRRRA